MKDENWYKDAADYAQGAKARMIRKLEGVTTAIAERRDPRVIDGWLEKLLSDTMQLRETLNSKSGV